MATIQQAAAWLQQGRDVQRKGDTWWLSPYYPDKTTFAVVDANGREHSLNTYDILADDWEIANGTY